MGNELGGEVGGRKGVCVCVCLCGGLLAYLFRGGPPGLGNGVIQINKLASLYVTAYEI